jgi:hypothetical protein
MAILALSVHGRDARTTSCYRLRIIAVPFIAPVLLLRKFGDPPTTAGLGLRWGTLLSDSALGRTILGVRTGKALWTVSFEMNPPFAVPPDLSEPG